jgi:DNA invertase Pin-like site-specific DNA recombinase
METRIAYSYIRFSTKIQAQGDSLRRQKELTDLYIKEHNDNPNKELILELDKSLNMYDLGVSAFHGLNKKKGALSSFLQLIENGAITKGSYLIVENLDRLSRENVDDALDQFRDIIRADISIVTLQDRMVYSKESMRKNWSQFITAITYMANAYGGSNDKSLRLKSTNQNKRDSISDNFKLTSKCPSWLKAIKEPISSASTKTRVTHYEIIPDAVDVIKEIFKMKLDDGYGFQKIANELNRKGLWTPPGRISRNPNRLSLPPSWRKSYIDKILRNNRAVLGEYQPHKMIKDKRVPTGKPIQNYFPAIIDEETYNRMQTLIQPYDKDNLKKHAGGRNGIVSNLFGTLTFCSKCGFPMQYINKGYTSPLGQQLVCDKEERSVNGGCIKEKISYKLFEENVLRYCLSLDVSNIIPSSRQRTSELGKLQKHLQAIQGELPDIKEQLPLVAMEITRTSNEILKEAHRHNASILALKQEKLEKDEKETLEEIRKLNNSQGNSKEQLENVQELIKRMKELKDDARVELRLSLRNQLRHLIKFIKVDASNGSVIIFFKSGESRQIWLYEEVGSGRRIVTAWRSKSK